MASTPVPRQAAGAKKLAGYAGVATAGLALGLTELAAGLSSGVPSAVSAVGAYLIDIAPTPVKDFAIQTFGTADKGALGIGTVLISLVLGFFVGRAALKRSWVGMAAFAALAVVGIAAAFGEPSYEPAITLIAIAGSAGIAGFVLNRLLARIATAPAPVPTDGVPGDGGRRRFIAGTVGVGAAAALSGFAGRSLVIRRSEEVRTNIALPAAADPVAAPSAAASFSVDGLTPILVPNDNFYRIDTAIVVPRPDVESWSLRFTGMVDNPFELTYADLLAMPLVEEYVTLSCVSNEVGGGLVGNASWLGVPLADLLERAGVQSGADQLVGRAVDDFTVGFPTEIALDGRQALVAVGMNGEPLPPVHGFPARLVVPGLYGYVSATKWLSEIELTTWDAFDAYWVPRGWAKEGPIKTQSRIDVPGDGATVSGAPLVIAGVAWAPTREIAAVEVRIDDGEWMQAELTEPLSDASWVQWMVTTNLDPGSAHTCQVRATDGTGETQTEMRTPVAPDGASGWHTIEFRTA
ncbi:MAG: molybdopterin-dependent oxidoreductase [Actinomycetota bacterium]|nr:molybdopterin-dependent oxidoreductase [Actinomycetota bacterium]